MVLLLLLMIIRHARTCLTLAVLLLLLLLLLQVRPWHAADCCALLWPRAADDRPSRKHAHGEKCGTGMVCML
jgi:hypothetical protein